MITDSTDPSDREAELAEENAALKAQLAGTLVTATGSHTALFVGAVVFLAFLAIASIITIFITRPDKDNTALIAIVLGFLVPLSTALLGAAVQQVHLAVNGRLSQLMQLTAKSARAEGQLAGKTEARTRASDFGRSDPTPVPVEVMNTPIAVAIKDAIVTGAS